MSITSLLAATTAAANAAPPPVASPKPSALPIPPVNALA